MNVTRDIPDWMAAEIAEGFEQSVRRRAMECQLDRYPYPYANPYLPEPSMAAWQVRVYDEYWNSRGLFDDRPADDPPPPMRVELTPGEWAELLGWHAEMQAARQLPQFPRPMFPRFRPSVLGYSLLQLAYLLHREYREQLAGQARGRIRFREGKF